MAKKKEEDNLICSNKKASYEYFLQAIALDTLPNEKGKIKPRYVKDIRKTLKQKLINSTSKTARTMLLHLKNWALTDYL